jgi:Anti-sigma-D factor RsdA to sigma factor binding region
VHDLDDVWRDDQLIEALASGEPVDTADPAAAPLRALTGLVDAAPIPDYDIRDLETLGNIVVLDTGRSRRVAVRSLAVALTAVATLSTSGVAAVVTGDPFQPAKVVWHQIQERAGDRWGGDPLDDEDRLDSGSAIGGDTGEADTAGASGTSAQSAVFEAARQAEEASRLQRVALPRQSPETKDGLEAGQAPSRDRAVAEAEATDGPQAAAPSPAQEQTAAEERQTRQDEESSGTATSEDSAQQREDAQRSEEEQESQDSRRSDQPEEDEQEPTPDAPSDDLDPRVVPDSPEEDPTDGYGSMRSTEDSDDSEDSDEDSEEFDGSTFSDSAPDEGTSSTEEPTEEESEDDGSWTGWPVQERAGSTDETVAPPRLNR